MMSDAALVNSASVEGRTPGTSVHGGHGSWYGYLVGYFASALLTVSAFWMATSTAMTPSSIVAGLCVLAIAQMLVHLIFFLHINTAPEQRTNIMALGVTLIIIGMVVIGSLWITAHLRDNMMPMNKLMQIQR